MAKARAKDHRQPRTKAKDNISEKKLKQTPVPSKTGQVQDPRRPLLCL